jgi:hypothetical protein
MLPSNLLLVGSKEALEYVNRIRTVISAMGS